MTIRKILIILVVSVLVAEASALTFNRKQRSVDTCGKSKVRQPFIVNGKSFTRGTFPWAVALNYQNFTKSGFFCAGTLISKTFVISAAHCILPKHETKKLQPDNILAFFGAHKLDNFDETFRYELSPEEIFLHPEWNTTAIRYDGDLSLLEFKAGKIYFNNFVQPICLWKSENEQTLTHGIVAGWGKNEDSDRDHENIPKMINASIQANDECFIDEERLLPLSSRRTFCASPGNNSGVCVGDSGSGFFFNIQGVYHLKGIVSTSLDGVIGCDVSVKAVYSNVPKYNDWIESTVHPASVICFFGKKESVLLKKTAKYCLIKDSINNENNVLGSTIDTSCKIFYIRFNKDVEYLPRKIGKILPNLQQIIVENCGLKIVRDFYFKNMRKLRFLDLSDNEIVTIEANAFKDLISVKAVWLANNLIQTLDGKLFVSMTNLKGIFLTSNKIKFLTPATFKIFGGSLVLVDLVDNICIHQVYNTAEQLNGLESDLKSQCSRKAKALSPQDLKNVVCLYEQIDSSLLKRKVWRCYVNQKIESEDYFVLKEPTRLDVEYFETAESKYVKFLPKNIGEKFPNLKKIHVNACGLTVVRNFYFKNMQNLKSLILTNNKIATIEAEAFKDLVSVEDLLLNDNLIETLDENLFASMVSVKGIILFNNKIKFLSPTTFKISGGRLRYVGLGGNACTMNGIWAIKKRESYLIAECSQN